MNLSVGAGLRGIAQGALAGGLATAVEIYLVVIVFGWIGAPRPPPPMEVLTAAVIGLPLVPFVTIIASLAFVVGLGVVGLPLWAAFHALRLRSRWLAAIAGAFLASASIWVLDQPWEVGGTGFSWPLLGLVLPGGIAGWTLHRAAYGRDPNP